ncbi:hypothetical protein CEB3_c17530 [Peptococcaceae bacterium CEB3]|nr:hypothetical protein CEB3_c17530 [Peptococcaceae bacterium CEB3]
MSDKNSDKAVEADLSSSFDAILSHKELCQKDDVEIHCLLYMLFPDRVIGSHTLDWRLDRQLALEAKGRKGGIKIGWLENFKADNLRA